VHARSSDIILLSWLDKAPVLTGTKLQELTVEKLSPHTSAHMDCNSRIAFFSRDGLFR